jgi:hypothetical protein
MSRAAHHEQLRDTVRRYARERLAIGRSLGGT